MATFERSFHVAAPLSRVWEFYTRIEGVEALTPRWMNLRVERVHDRDGHQSSDVLEERTQIRLSMHPFGVGRRLMWTSKIVHLDKAADSAVFRDQMIGGPFTRWIHTHGFYADAGGTLVRDTIEYELPGGRLGRSVSPLALVGFEPVFRYRERRTRDLLE